MTSQKILEDWIFCEAINVRILLHFINWRCLVGRYCFAYNKKRLFEREF
jgi:hypothetical protein